MNGSDTLTWLLLNDRATDAGEVSLSLSQIAYATGLSRISVTRAIKRLTESGRVVHLGRTAHHAPTTYRVVERPELLSKSAA